MLPPLLFFVAGCGSFGLAPANDLPIGRVELSPAAATNFGELLPEEQAAMAVFGMMSADEEDPGEVDEVWLEGDTGAFQIVGMPELPELLHGKQRLHVKVRFAPQESGSYEGNFVMSTTGGQKVRRALVGTGCRNRDGNMRCD